MGAFVLSTIVTFNALHGLIDGDVIRNMFLRSFNKITRKLKPVDCLKADRGLLGIGTSGLVRLAFADIFFEFEAPRFHFATHTTFTLP